MYYFGSECKNHIVQCLSRNKERKSLVVRTEQKKNISRIRGRHLMPDFWLQWLAIGVLVLIQFLPRKILMGLGALIGTLFSRLNKKRRDIAQKNIELCFPEKTDIERQQLLQLHFRTYGKGVLDLGLIWWGSERRLEKLTDCEGMEHYRSALKSGRPVIAITPHLIGLEFCGGMLSRLHPMVAMMKEFHNPLYNRLITKRRGRFGLIMVNRNQGLRPLLKGLKRGRSCFYIPDEDFGSNNSVFAPFFGQQAATLTTLGRMTKMTNALVLPCFAFLDPESGRYRFMIRDVLEDFPSGDQTADATNMNRAMEQGIRQAPEQYMWTQRWFRTQPDGQASPYE